MQGWLHRIGSETAVWWPEKFRHRPQIGRRSWQGAPDVLLAGPGLSPLALHDDLTVQGACDFLRMHFGGMYAVPADTPLLLMVSLQQPHFPLLCDGDLFEKHLDRVRLPADPSRAGHSHLCRSFLDVPAENILRARAAYGAMVETVDQKFARVLETVAACGQNIDDWLVVFTSDHGDLLGDHGCWEKRSFYEQSAGIPLFVRGPGFEAGTDDRLSNLVDLFPTLCHSAGLPVPEGLDGHDLHEPGPVTFSQLGSSHFMVRDDEWKFLTFGGEMPDVLFHVASDPAETHDLAAARPDQCARLRAQLMEVLGKAAQIC